MTGHRTGGTSTGILWALVGPAIWIAILLLVGSGEAGGTAHGALGERATPTETEAVGAVPSCRQPS